MGLCVSSDTSGVPANLPVSQTEIIQDHAISSQIQKDKMKDARVKKLLLLGPGASGKTTIYKQLVNLYGDKYDEEKLLSYKPIIYTNILFSIKQLVKWSDQRPELNITDQNKHYKAMVNDWKEDSDVTPDMISPIEALWHDSGIQATFKANAGRLLLLESLGYWMNKLDRITKDAYVPDLQDVLRSRAPTTGIVETEFEIEGSHFLMIDVGGQRNERKKWIHCFQEVTSLIFVASLNSYDQVLYEDETSNGMFEALNLFEDTINMDYFKNVDVILFLNKSDLFREKIKKTPLTVFFADYKGSQEFDECVSFIEEEFRLRVKDVDKDLYCHVTCATDTSNVQFTFNAVKNIIIRKGLSDAGIMG